MAPNRTLVAGWFSFPSMGATAGDLLALDVTCGWLADAGVPFDVALEPRFGAGVDWRRVDPCAYSHLVFVCGPFYARRRLLRVLPRWGATALCRLAPVLRRIGLGSLDRIVLELLVRRFARCRLVGLNVSMLGAPGAWHPFDALVQRDGPEGPSRADLALAHRGDTVPLVGLLLVERTGGIDEERQIGAEERIREVLDDRPVAVVHIDTRLDQPNAAGLRTAAEVESLIARMDAVVTTRMHGAVLALKHGVPAVALDLVPGGGKVARQMAVLGWPHVLEAEADAAAIGCALDACLTSGAQAEALAAGRRGAGLARSVERELLDALGPGRVRQ